MTAVIYARYSSDSQREESIEGQIREYTAFAEKNGAKWHLPRKLSLGGATMTDIRDWLHKKTPARHRAEDDSFLTTRLFCGCCGSYRPIKSAS